MTDHEMITISALRYALPRRSYIMSFTDEYITAMIKNKVSPNFIRVAIEDIESFIKQVEDPKDLLRYNWIPLLERLKEKTING